MEIRECLTPEATAQVVELLPGKPVKYEGRVVGYVTSARLDGSCVQYEMTFTGEGIPLKSGESFSFRTSMGL